MGIRGGWRAQTESDLSGQTQFSCRSLHAYANLARSEDHRIMHRFAHCDASRQGLQADRGGFWNSAFEAVSHRAWTVVNHINKEKGGCALARAARPSRKLPPLRIVALLLRRGDLGVDDGWAIGTATVPSISHR